MKKLIFFLGVMLMFSCSKDNNSSTGDETGKNGSVARFAIKDDFMYTIDFDYLRIFSLAVPSDPLLVQSVRVGYGLETIYIYGQHIYLGAVDGVYILNIDDPAHPHQTQKVEHHISCDPVVVQGIYAYSTQRVNNIGCGNFSWSSSALAVYDVSDPGNSELVKNIPMGEPYGLAVENTWLFVCDEDKGGVVVYDITNPADPIQKAITSVNEPRDIILMHPYMVVSTKTKFELYNYADPLNMYFVSSLILH